MDYVRNAAQRNSSVLRWGGRCVATLSCLWASLNAVVAEVPASAHHQQTNPPLVTIRQFLDHAREWGETNDLRLQGVVTASLADKSYFLQDGDAGVYVFHRPVEALPLGDWVEVTGHPSLGNFKPLLDGVAVRSLGGRASPSPVTVTYAEVMTGQHHMRLIRIRGRLAEERPRGGRNLVLNAGGSTNSFLADLDALPDCDAVSRIEPGSVIELTGVCNVRADITRTRPVSLMVFVRSAADVVVVSGPPWWTHERTFTGLAFALGSLGLALLWGWTLRRQVGRQTADLRARLEKEMTLEQRYRQLFESNPHPMWVYELDTLRFLAVNDAAIGHYGFARSEFLGMTLRDIRPPEEVPALEKAVASVVPGLNPAGVWRHRKKDGQVIEVEIKSHTTDFDGRPSEVVLALDVTERLRAEAALRHSEQYRRAIIETEPECVKVVAADGTLLDMNRAGLAMLEAGSFVEAASCPLMRYLRPEHHGAFTELHRRVMAGGSGMLEFEIEGLKGTRRWLETHAVLLPVAEGGQPALLGITRDVTERKKAQAEAQRSQERFATIFRASPDAIMIVRASDERIVEVNPAFERLMGFTAAEALGRTTAELGLWVDTGERAATIAQIKAGGAGLSGEARLRSKAGRIFDALSSAEMINYDGERCILSLTRDITERKAAEEQLRRSEASLVAAQHIASLGSWDLDLTDAVQAGRNPLTWSDEVFRIFGYEPGGLEVTNENFFRAVHPEDRERVRRAVAEAIAQRRPYRIEHRIVRPDGTERIVQEYSETTFDPASGRPVRLLGVVQDITTRRASEERIRNLNAELEQRVQERTSELEAANKELEAFSYSVSHDLRAPLRAIDGFSKMLQQDASSQLDEKSLRYLDRIRRGTERMGALIDDMLQLSRLSRAPMNRVEVDLSFMVRGALAELRAADPQRQVESLVAPDLKAGADATLLRAVLQNFVGNAWKYTSRRPKARIEFGAFDRDGERVFFIRDDGAGFDMAYADKLFGAFQRLHGADEFEGTGIGLATVQRVIHRHGGRVWAEAVVDRGATFFFTLAPRIKPTPSTP